MFGTHYKLWFPMKCQLMAGPGRIVEQTNVENGLTISLMSTHVVSTQHSNNNIFFLYSSKTIFLQLKNDENGQTRSSVKIIYAP